MVASGGLFRDGEVYESGRETQESDQTNGGDNRLIMSQRPKPISMSLAKKLKYYRFLSLRPLRPT
jgi:hypothetical protein